jgi:GNAT superfamily N-acetyltransferase
MQQADSLDRILAVESAAVKAWPAREVQVLDGWHLRYSDGVTRRANSVWPNRSEGSLDLERKVEAVEAFYAARSLPARFQICPAARPSGLDTILNRRSYRAVSRTGVQVRAITEPDPAAPVRQDPVTVASVLSEEWLRCYAIAEGFAPAQVESRREILSRIDAPVGFALVEQRGEPMAVGLGVVHSEWLGISCMSTLPAFRRRGAASALLAALLQWARRWGASHTYLQVMDGNGPARALYAGLGFETLYHYHYRERVLGEA